LSCYAIGLALKILQANYYILEENLISA